MNKKKISSIGPVAIAGKIEKKIGRKGLAVKLGIAYHTLSGKMNEFGDFTASQKEALVKRSASF